MFGTDYWKLTSDITGRSTAVAPATFWAWTLAPFNRSLTATVQHTAASLGIESELVRQAVELDLPNLLEQGHARLDVAPPA